MRTAVRIVLIAIAAILALVFLGVMTLTNTDWGRERVRRFTLDALGKSAHGIIHLGTIQGNLLEEVILVDLSITDSAGRPFVSIRRARAQYRISDLLRQRIEDGELGGNLGPCDDRDERSRGIR